MEKVLSNFPSCDIEVDAKCINFLSILLNCGSRHSKVVNFLSKNVIFLRKYVILFLMKVTSVSAKASRFRYVLSWMSEK